LEIFRLSAKNSVIDFKPLRYGNNSLKAVKPLSDILQKLKLIVDNFLRPTRDVMNYIFAMSVIFSFSGISKLSEAKFVR